ncbi:alginate O-acetyltransferase AlgX-related protein [Paludisphaera borealis]|uniref:Acetyltransferase n=1 Tax=Paludisphaera borealis TaxID=1387353 RepID=A0A1U7CMV8_9BACT|nr:hypothetical protein [Paludisphaera borealis]APW60257.1 acetyltransferase [Paludisphaera borealis]
MPYEHRPKASGRRADLLLIVGFFSILVYPALSLVENPEELKARGVTEKRALTPRPPIWQFAAAPSKFVADFKSFFEDQFEGRGQLVTFNSLLRYNVFDVSTNASVLPGKHGAMFFAGEAVVPRHDFGHETARYRRVLPVTDRRLKRLQDLLESRRKWAESMGAKFVFVVAPDKSTTYSELLPEWLNPLDGPTFTDQLIDHLKATTNIEIVDLRPALEKAKQPGKPLFYLRDTHWNYEGALVGYHETTRWLKEKFPAITPFGPDDLVRKGERHQGDMTQMLHLGTRLSERSHQVLLKSPRSAIVPFEYDSTPVSSWAAPPITYKSHDARLPKALVYHDSFMLLLMPYLAENFDSSIFIRDQRVVTSTVKGYKPDVVIFECVERTLYYLAYITDDLLPTIEPAMIAENPIQSSSHVKK